jgi:hypothetical protein
VTAALRLGALLLAVSLLAGCGGNSSEDGSAGGLEEWLRRMVLDLEDLPDGLVLGDESLSDNESAAGGSEDRAAQLEDWGRQLGYDVAYLQEAGQTQSVVRGVNVSATLYRTAGGAADSFADAVATAEATDWPANYAGLTEFQQEDVTVGEAAADDVVWLRFSGYETAEGEEGTLVTDDLIFFRIGRERGFLRVLAHAGQTDERGHLQESVSQWLTALIEKVDAALSEGGFDEDEG